MGLTNVFVIIRFESQLGCFQPQLFSNSHYPEENERWGISKRSLATIVLSLPGIPSVNFITYIFFNKIITVLLLLIPI